MAGRRNDGERIPAASERSSRRRTVVVDGRETALEMSFDRIGVIRGLGVDVDGVIRVGEAIDFFGIKLYFLSTFRKIITLKISLLKSHTMASF